MYSYDVGALPSAIAGVAAGIAALPWTFMRNRLHPLFAVGLAAAAFSMVFALANPLMQGELLTVELLRQEIASGHLALRVTSVLVGISFCILFWRVSRESGFQSSMGHDPEDDHRQFQRERRRGAWTIERALAQAVLFMIVLVGLWIFVMTEHSSVLIALVNWLFLFISDDFVMCANYIAYRRAAPPFLDALKIVAGSLATVVVFLVVLFREYDQRIAWTALAFTLVTVVVMLWRAVTPFLVTGWSTFGILPDEEDWRPYEDPEVLVAGIEKLRDQGVLTEEEAESKLRLVPLLYEHGLHAHEVLTKAAEFPVQQEPPAHQTQPPAVSPRSTPGAGSGAAGV
ncbi:hypothetical protein ACFU3J_25595 [Streptomyces sp. NPDC057411]|uniref:hypothetical protein n=1 Tax=unclassified Streptomyces TaxID=2593676 RepID=UPI0036455513